MNLKWIQSGLKMDLKWIQNGFKMELKCLSSMWKMICHFHLTYHQPGSKFYFNILILIPPSRVRISTHRNIIWKYILARLVKLGFADVQTENCVQNSLFVDISLNYT